MSLFSHRPRSKPRPSLSRPRPIATAKALILRSLSLEKPSLSRGFRAEPSRHITTLDNAWTSRPVCALVVPGLCTEILLGLPFLVDNKIVVDHDAQTAIY